MTEIIPKEAPKMPKWLIFMFYFSLILLSFFIIAYFRTNGSIKKNQAVLNGLNNDLLSLQSSENTVLKKQVLDYDRRIKDFKNLVIGHKFNSRAFKFLEDFAHPRVVFNSFELQAEDNKVLITGTAETFESLGQQIIILQKEQEKIKDLILESISISKTGEIEFTFSFFFNESTLQ